MYKREQASRTRQEFWTVFGRYMSPIPSAEGMKINWVNYHTGVKDVFFRMDAGVNTASICISLEHRLPQVQELYFEQFLQLKSLLHATLNEEWHWDKHVQLEGKSISRICKSLPNASIFNKEQWPDLISFFKPRIIGLDAFWENAKYSFDELK